MEIRNRARSNRHLRDLEELTIVFEDCENATLTYELTDPELMGSIALTRIALDNVALCEALNLAAQLPKDKDGVQVAVEVIEAVARYYQRRRPHRHDRTGQSRSRHLYFGRQTKGPQRSGRRGSRPFV